MRCQYHDVEYSDCTACTAWTKMHAVNGWRATRETVGEQLNRLVSWAKQGGPGTPKGFLQRLLPAGDEIDRRPVHWIEISTQGMDPKNRAEAIAAGLVLEMGALPRARYEWRPITEVVDRPSSGDMIVGCAVVDYPFALEWDGMRPWIDVPTPWEPNYEALVKIIDSLSRWQLYEYAEENGFDPLRESHLLVAEDMARADPKTGHMSSTWLIGKWELVRDWRLPARLHRMLTAHELKPS